jgi:hypothetical protein
LSDPAHVSLILNTDGVALYRSSKVSIWPVWAIVNELPPSKRFLRQHMLLLGIFYSRDKPFEHLSTSDYWWYKQCLSSRHQCADTSRSAGSWGSFALLLSWFTS